MSIHTEELKLNLRAKHKELLNYMAMVRDTKTAILAREILIAGVDAECKRLGVEVDASGNIKRSP